MRRVALYLGMLLLSCVIEAALLVVGEALYAGRPGVTRGR